MNPVGAWWLACVLWSSTFLFIKVGLAEIPPFTFASLRLLLALCVLAPLTARDDGWRRVTRSDARVIAAAGVLLLGVTGFAAWIPARRVTRVDAVQVLRA